MPVVNMALGIRGTQVARGGSHQQTDPAHEAGTWQGSALVGQVVVGQLVQIQVQAQLQPQFGVFEAGCGGCGLFFLK